MHRAPHLTTALKLLSNRLEHGFHAAGILCEEMGLGKSVEVISAILTHRAPHPAIIEPLSARMKRLPPADSYKTVDYAAMLSRDHQATRVCGHKCSGCGAGMSSEQLPACGPPPDPLLCSQCCHQLASQEVTGVSKATLIVCPSALLSQWYGEIERHTAFQALKVVVYNGQRKQSLSNAQGMAVDDAVLSVTARSMCTSRTESHGVS